MRMLTLAAAFGLALALPLSPAAGQTSGSTTTSAFDQLSPGGRSIAKAIFNAQVQPTTTTTTGSTGGTSTGTGTGTTTTTTSSPQPLTLDEITQKKLDGEGWGKLFKDMKAQGLISSNVKNLGQAVSTYRHSLHQGNGTTTTASGKPFNGGSGNGNGKGNWKDEGGSGGTGGSGGSGASSSSSSLSASSHGNAGGNSGSHGGGGGGGNAYGKSK